MGFFEDSHEYSIDIFEHLWQFLTVNSLEVNYVSTFSADNANVNYGKHNSVLTKFVEKNPDILKTNCNCHVIHNAGNNAQCN